MKRTRAALVVVVSLAFAGTAGSAGSPVDVAADRGVEVVVLTGAQLPEWSGGAELTARRPQVLGGQGPAGQIAPYALEPSSCQDERTANDPTTDHSCYQTPDVAVYGDPVRHGAPVDRLLGYRWNPVTSAFVQIPFQVDERFTRYLSNNRSGFAFYSGVDQHTTYAFDKENFRFVENGSNAFLADKGYHGLCDSRPRPDGTVAAADPLPGLDDNDELAFMAADAGAMAPLGAALPAGIEEAVEVRLTDPLDPATERFVYVMRAADGGPRRAFDAANGYVRYQRDPKANMFVYSQSSYGGYGAAPKGPYCDPNTGALVTNPDGSPKIAQRRPLDTAWVKTNRYEFRYDGRWLMTELHVSPNDSGLGTANYGPDLIDRWKARAFQQDPSSDTPCCGYEEEDTNWGGSTIIMGERVGPVRAIRETWGADSGTNVVRRETFYARSINHSYYLRVHVIPPLDGIYTQWDYNAGRMLRYYNPMRPEGVDIDGQNDEVLGNVDDPCNPYYATAYGETFRSLPSSCSSYHQSVDVFDPTLSAPNATLQWEEAAGPWGTLVTRWQVKDPNPAGTAQGLVAVPYYRDDSCFDDGTGTNPGPRVKLRSSSEIRFVPDGSEGQTSGPPRKCWTPADQIPDETIANSGSFRDGSASKPWPKGDIGFFQGDIGAHGLHLLFQAESDNASLTVPVSEIDSQQWQVILPGNPGNVGERYGRVLEKPLVATAAPRPDL
jgi:hypothetical protein